MRDKLIAYLVALLRRLFGKDKGRSRLNPVSNLEATVMAKNVKLTWTNPTTRTDNAPAAVTEIKTLIFSARLKALPDFQEVGRTSDPAQIAAAVANFPNTPSGTWIFQVAGIDTDNQPFAAVTEIEVVIPKAALNPVTNLQATLS